MATLKPAGAVASSWKEEREIRGGSTKWRPRVWLGGREQVIKELLEAGAEAVAMTCGTQQDLSHAKGRSPSF